MQAYLPCVRSAQESSEHASIVVVVPTPAAVARVVDLRCGLARFVTADPTFRGILIKCTAIRHDEISIFDVRVVATDTLQAGLRVRYRVTPARAISRPKLDFQRAVWIGRFCPV